MASTVDEDLAALRATSDAMVAIDLGKRFQAAGSLNAARAAFQKASQLAQFEFQKGTAALLLGGVLEKLHDFTGAERAFGDAIATESPDLVPVAAFGLALMRIDLGDSDGAVRALRITVASTHRVAPRAALELGHLLSQAGDGVGARAAWGRAVESADPVASPRGRLRIAMLDYKEGDRDAAIGVIRELARSAPKRVAVSAAYFLGMKLGQEGHIEEARVALEPLLTCGELLWVTRAQQALRRFLQH